MIRIVTEATPSRNQPLWRLWKCLTTALARAGIAVHNIALKQWGDGRGTAQVGSDVIIADAAAMSQIPPDYAAIGYYDGAPVDKACTRRKHTIWVATDDWAARQFRAYTGRGVTRIIFGGTDTDAYFPSERQIVRKVPKPVVLCDGPMDAAGEVAARLGAPFTVRVLQCDPDDRPDALRRGDIWLSLETQSIPVQSIVEAAATNLVIVGPPIGLLWAPWQPPADIGARLCKNTDAPHIASVIKDAWARRGHLHGRDYARQWFSLQTLGRKWLEAISAATRQLGNRSA